MASVPRTWYGDGRSFLWSARVGWGPLSVLRAVDRFADGAGSMDVLLFGRVPVIHADDVDTARSAAGRAAVEAAIWAPAALLPSRGVEWRAEREDVIVASWDVPPERPEVRLELDAAGGVRSCSVMRGTAARTASAGTSRAAPPSTPSAGSATSSSPAA